MASVAEQLKHKRELVGWSQSLLAAATGIAQPNISAYESGLIVPRPETVHRLMAAMRLRPSVVVERLRGEILDAASRHRVVAVQVFGSLVTGRDTHDSDVDLLVHLEPGASWFDLALFADEVEEIIGFPVDAISADSIGSAMRRIRAEAVPL